MTLSRTYALASVLVAGLAVASATPLHADARSDAREQVEFGISVAQRGLWREAIKLYDQALAEPKSQRKAVFINFTGHT